MEENIKSYILMGTGAVIFLVSLGVFFIANQTKYSSTDQVLEDCKVLLDNGPGKINMLFFADKESTEKYMNFFFETPPFDESKDSFNFYYIDNYFPDCDLYRGIATFCHSRQLMKKAASCPHDVITVLDTRPNTIRSSTYLNVMSINTVHILTVFSHEVGHAFANFAEEYINNQNPPRGSLNCQKECIGFEGETNGCFQGCSQTNLYRSIENGVMRTLNSNDFGFYNLRKLREIIKEGKIKSFSPPKGSPLFAPGDITDECLGQKNILVNGIINEDSTINIIQKSIQPGCPGGSAEGDYSYTATGADGEPLLVSSLNPFFVAEGPGKNNEIEGDQFPVTDFNLQLLIESLNLVIYDADGNELISESLEDAGALLCQP
jgi:hypothetical protein